MTKKIRNLVIGENVNTPSLNVAAHFFGLGQIEIPQRNFARFLVMMFILYCLIIRTTWQSKMFEFMQKEMRKPEVKTIKEANETYGKNYNLYNNETEFSNGSKGKMPYYTEILTFLDDSSFEGALKLKSQHIPFIFGYHLNLTTPYLLQRMLKNKPYSEAMCGFSFPLNHKLYESFNKVSSGEEK
jgi:hypothetical protein